MSKLENRHSDVYLKFVNGRHVVRRSKKFWAGLSSDLVIEQTLMRSLKTSGGLTNGSGINEEQCSLWTMSMPVTAMYNMTIQDFSNQIYTTSSKVVKESSPKTDHYVLDGGSYLHRVPWKTGDSYGSIAQSEAA